MKRLYMLMSFLVLTSGLGAKIYIPEGKNDFLDGLSRHPYAVVHYINYEQVGDDKLKQQALESMKTAFNQSSNESAHVLAKLSFIGINSRIAPDLMTDLEKQYNVQKTDTSKDFSIIFLLNNGKPVLDEAGRLAMLKNAFDQADLGTFIEKYLGDYIAYQIQQTQAQQYTIQEPRTVTRYVEQPVYRYSYDPYYYDDYYYRRRPRFGIGVGFGGGWGWGRRGWWGPGFGIGVGF